MISKTVTIFLTAFLFLGCKDTPIRSSGIYVQSDKKLSEFLPEFQKLGWIQVSGDNCTDESTVEHLCLNRGRFFGIDNALISRRSGYPYEVYYKFSFSKLTADSSKVELFYKTKQVIEGD